MKQAINFRLSPKAINTLLILEEKLHTSKTAVIENALQWYAKKKLPDRDLLLGYAGILNEETASSMLTNIQSSRYDKGTETRL